MVLDTRDVEIVDIRRDATTRVTFDTSGTLAVLNIFVVAGLGVNRKKGQ